MFTFPIPPQCFLSTGVHRRQCIAFFCFFLLCTYGNSFQCLCPTNMPKSSKGIDTTGGFPSSVRGVHACVSIWSRLIMTVKCGIYETSHGYMMAQTRHNKVASEAAEQSLTRGCLLSAACSGMICGSHISGSTIYISITFSYHIKEGLQQPFKVLTGYRMDTSVR